jgi:hypothetical protein
LSGLSEKVKDKLRFGARGAHKHLNKTMHANDGSTQQDGRAQTPQKASTDAVDTKKTVEASPGGPGTDQSEAGVDQGKIASEHPMEINSAASHASMMGTDPVQQQSHQVRQRAWL